VSSSQLMFYQDRYFVRLQSRSNESRKDYPGPAPGLIRKPPGQCAGSAQRAGILKFPALVPKSEPVSCDPEPLGLCLLCEAGIIADAAAQNERCRFL